MRELGDDGAAAAAAAYHRIVAETARANDGVEVERAGDGRCVSSRRRRVRFSRSRRSGRSFADSDWIQGIEKPELAAAVHTGRVTSLAGATRIASAARRALCVSAEPGQVLVSHSTQALLEGEVLGELELRDLGERELPGMTPTRVYELVRPPGSC